MKEIENRLKPENKDPKALEQLLTIVREEKPDATEADGVKFARYVLEKSPAETNARAAAYENCSAACGANAMRSSL